MPEPSLLASYACRKTLPAWLRGSPSNVARSLVGTVACCVETPPLAEHLHGLRLALASASALDPPVLNPFHSALSNLGQLLSPDLPPSCLNLRAFMTQLQLLCDAARLRFGAFLSNSRTTQPSLAVEEEHRSVSAFSPSKTSSGGEARCVRPVPCDKANHRVQSRRFQSSCDSFFSSCDELSQLNSSQVVALGPELGPEVLTIYRGTLYSAVSSHCPNESKLHHRKRSSCALLDVAANRR